MTSSGSSAKEHEIDRMVVRLVGNQEDYQKMLKDVEQQTEKSAQWAEDQGNKITNAFSKAFRSAQGAISSTGSGISQIGQTMQQPAQQQKEVLGKAALDFSEYGKSIKDMVRESEKAGKEAEELMKRTVKGTEAYKELEKVVKLSTEEMQVFKLMSERTGISVGELSKTIKVGSEEYEKWRKETERFGLMFDDESLKKADELAESWQRVRQAMQGMWAQVGSAVADRFKELNERIEGIVVWIIKWVKENKELITRSVELTAKIGAVGIAVSALGTAISTVGALLGPITVMVGAGVAAWTLWNKESEQALNTDLLSQYTENFKGLYNQVVTYGKQIVDHVSRTMDGIFDAIKAGNLELAVEIAWSGVKVLWIRSLKELNDLTGEQFGAIFNNLATGDWMAALEALWVEIKLLWNKGLLELLPLWNKMVDMADTTWTSIEQSARTTWAEIQNVVDTAMFHITETFTKAAKSAQKAWLPFGSIISGALAAQEFLTGDVSGAINRVRSQVEHGMDVFTEESTYEQREAELGRRTAQRLANAEMPEEDLERRQQTRGQAAIDSDFETLIKIAELEAEKAEMQAEGNEEAVRALSLAQEELNAKLQQAEAEKYLAEIQRARGRDAQQLHDQEEEANKRRLQNERDRQGIEEKWDPIERYRRQLKELNYLYEEADRGSRAYRSELEDMQDQLAAGLFARDAQFGNVGFDAVMKGTRGEQELIQNTLQQSEMDRARHMGVEEADERDIQAEEEARTQAEFNELVEHGKSLTSIAGYCGELVGAANRDQDKPKIHLAPLEVS